MYRVDNSTAAAALPAPTAAGPNPDGYYTDGNPGGGTSATVVDGEHLNMLQEEIAGAVEAAGLTLDKADRAQLATAVAILVGGDPGDVKYHAASTAPTGWLKADGAAVSRTTYAALFAVIGTTYGAGDGSTTFNLPDLRGEFLRGWDDGRGVDSGRAFGSAQGEDLKGHTHDVRTVDDSTGGSNLDIVRRASAGNVTNLGGKALNGGGAETRPRNAALLSVIKF